jgi:pimeloyl-ACP methyl ester carboxylesterase
MIGHSFGGWLSMNFALRGILGGMAGNAPVIQSMVEWLPLHQSVF